jgi:hypothetical protein
MALPNSFVAAPAGPARRVVTRLAGVVTHFAREAPTVT